MKKIASLAGLIVVGAFVRAGVASASPLLIDLEASQLMKGLFQQNSGGPKGNDTQTTPESSGDHGPSGDSGPFVSGHNGEETTLGELLNDNPGPHSGGPELPITDSLPSFSDNEESGGVGSDGESEGGAQQNFPAPETSAVLLPLDEGIVTVPEPGTTLLLASGLAGLIFIRKRSA